MAIAALRRERIDDGLHASSVADALNGVAWVDDAQIIELHAYKLYAKGAPFARIDISKPDEARAMIEKVSYAPRIEPFARQTFGGWDKWGDEV